MKIIIEQSDNIKDILPGDLVDNYAELGISKKQIDKRMKSLKNFILKLAEKGGVQVSSKTKKLRGEKNIISVQKKRIGVVNKESLRKLCTKKKIQIGKVQHKIEKKTDVPKNVLKMLDKYFKIEEVWEVATEDVKEAVRLGEISEKDFESVIDFKDSYAVLHSPLKNNVER